MSRELDILARLRAVFDSDSVPEKNIALREAHDEIKWLQAGLKAIADDPEGDIEAAAYARDVLRKQIKKWTYTP